MGPEGIKVDLQMIRIFNDMTITRSNRKYSKILLSRDEKIALDNSKALTRSLSPPRRHRYDRPSRPQTSNGRLVVNELTKDPFA